MGKLRFGVLGAAKIAREKVIPPLLRAQRCEVVALASRDAVARCRGGKTAGRAAQLWQLRGAAGRSGSGRGLQSPAQPPAPALDRQGRRGRQARAVREADRPGCGGVRAADRGAGPDRRGDPGSVHGPHPSAMAEGAGAGAWRPDRRAQGDPRPFQLSPDRPHERAQRGRVGRRRAARHRLLPDHHLALRHRAGAAPGGRDHRARPGERHRPAGHRHPGLRCRPVLLPVRDADRCRARPCSSTAPGRGWWSRSASTRPTTFPAG